MNIAGYDINNAARIIKNINLLTMDQKLNWQNKSK